MHRGHRGRYQRGLGQYSLASLINVLCYFDQDRWNIYCSIIMAFVFRKERFNEQIQQKEEDQPQKYTSGHRRQQSKQELTSLNKRIVKGLPSATNSSSGNQKTDQQGKTLDIIKAKRATIGQIKNSQNVLTSVSRQHLESGTKYLESGTKYLESGTKYLESGTKYLESGTKQRKQIKQIGEDKQLKQLLRKAFQPKQNLRDPSYPSLLTQKYFRSKETFIEAQQQRRNLQKINPIAKREKENSGNKRNTSLVKVLQSMNPALAKPASDYEPNLNIQRRQQQQAALKTRKPQLYKNLRIKIFQKSAASLLKGSDKAIMCLSSGGAFLTNISNPDEQVKHGLDEESYLKKKQKKKIMYIQQQQNQQTHQQSEYEENASPGPGSYDYSPDQKKDFRSKKQKFRNIFISPLQRFDQTGFKFQEVTYVNDSDSVLKFRGNQGFMSKSPKDICPRSKDESPSPGHYQTRQSLQHQIVKKLLKSSNSSYFYSGQPRLKYAKKQAIPAPGYYDSEVVSRAAEQKNTLTSSYKSKVERNFYLSDSKSDGNKPKIFNELLSASQLEKQVKIHKKDDCIKEDVYYVEPPPFMSGTQRFKQVEKELHSPKVADVAKGKKTEDNVAKEPFNSSQKRQMSIPVGEGVGVGLYNPNPGWEKKSYNVLFN